MIGLPRTYHDVAKEISEGLASGCVLLESESIGNEMWQFAGLLVQYLAPKKVAFVVRNTTARGTVGGRSLVMMQIDPEAFESLSEEIKTRFSEQAQDLRSKGVEIKIKDLRGERIYLDEYRKKPKIAPIEALRTSS